MITAQKTLKLEKAELIIIDGNPIVKLTFEGNTIFTTQVGTIETLKYKFSYPAAAQHLNLNDGKTYKISFEQID